MNNIETYKIDKKKNYFDRSIDLTNPYTKDNFVKKVFGLFSLYKIKPLISKEQVGFIVKEYLKDKYITLYKEHEIQVMVAYEALFIEKKIRDTFIVNSFEYKNVLKLFLLHEDAVDIINKKNKNLINNNINTYQIDL